MSPELAELLARWRAAADVLQNASINTLSQPDDNGAHDNAIEESALALEQLLKQQAGILVKRHDQLQNKTPLDSVNLELLETRLEQLATMSMSKFYAYQYNLLPYCWRQIYSDTLILTAYFHLLQSVSDTRQISESAMDKVVEMLDRSLIVAGGAGKLLGARWIEQALAQLESFWAASDESNSDDRPKKRLRPTSSFTTEPVWQPTLSKDCPRHTKWSINKFETYMNDKTTNPRPVVFTDLVKDTWPALNDRPWANLDYLLSKTFGGRRLVPVEVGRSYVDTDWGQELIPFKAFVNRYLDGKQAQVGYLAQHDLFHQIPSLRNDTAIPDQCWADVPGHPVDPSKNKEHVDVPQLNAWFGPAGTITPLHTDAYHNLLVQVVGTKYVRLYPPWEGIAMRPRSKENGVDMSNTSALDVGVLEGWDAVPEGSSTEEIDETRKALKDVEYWECILREGDTLLIPMGWWHYVRSLTVSFSVSFWWN
ncbi:hypothetical protein VHEMI03384 [[Torrubiella] hemipterigena]|uniref:JmjC domain-containing protein n=1 Tax=[Torrubiella] hemipterigena TaxID=1531966 RepID=A0A0A1TAN7_9HYPO|nr:hypothetical protein VHEMI03384 [[Torrubiella] hemipterigena]